MSFSLVKLFVPGIYLVLLFGSTPCHENSCNLPNINDLFISRVAICLVARVRILRHDESLQHQLSTDDTLGTQHERTVQFRTLTSYTATAAECSIKASKRIMWICMSQFGYCWYCFGFYHSSSKDKMTRAQCAILESTYAYLPH